MGGIEVQPSVVKPVNSSRDSYPGTGHHENIRGPDAARVERPPVVARAKDGDRSSLPVGAVAGDGESNGVGPGGHAAVVPHEPPFLLVAEEALHDGGADRAAVPGVAAGPEVENEAVGGGRRGGCALRRRRRRRRPPRWRGMGGGRCAREVFDGLPAVVVAAAVEVAVRGAAPAGGDGARIADDPRWEWGLCEARTSSSGGR